jgi:quinol monooxygenase YgiN
LLTIKFKNEQGAFLNRNHIAETKQKRTAMMLATTKVEEFDRFMKIFSTKGAKKRKQHGSKGAIVYRDPTEADRVWVLFDWDEAGFKNFLSGPEVRASSRKPDTSVNRSPPSSAASSVPDVTPVSLGTVKGAARPGRRYQEGGPPIECRLSCFLFPAPSP